MSKITNLPSGSTIAHYRIEEKIGEGGMGQVYRGHDTTLERKVALKVLPPELLTSTDRVRRFVQEAKSASALNHPNIVTIYEIGQVRVELPDPSESVPDEAIHYIAMEFIDGETLKTHIKRGSNERTLLDILAQVADGLAKAHNAGIVHRDLKPDNIMVTTDGFAKVVDFGLAKLTEKSASAADVEKTQEGMVMGTIGYMSPEQVQAKHVDQRSDIFSFGCILYEAVTKRRPFQADAAIDTMHKIVFGAPPPVREFMPAAPTEMEGIIQRCLAKKPEDRYPSIKEVGVAIRDIIKRYDVETWITTGEELTMMTPMPGMLAVPEISPSSSPSHGSSPPFATPQSTPPQFVPQQSAPPLPSLQASVPSLGLGARPRREPFRIGPWISRIVILAIVALIGYVWWTHPDVSKMKEGAARPLAVEQAANAGTKIEYEWAGYDEIASSLRRAIVAAEEPGYFEREEMQSKSVQAALTQMVKAKKLPSVSPISRNVARSLYVSSSNPLARMQELIIAYDLERTMSKERILELRLNSLKFGENVIGAEAAARHYFEKSASRLNLKQAALLAAATSSPVPADPSNPDKRLLERRDALLERMEGAARDEPAPETKSRGDAKKSKTSESKAEAKPEPETVTDAPPETIEEPPIAEPVPEDVAPAESGSTETTTTTTDPPLSL